MISLVRLENKAGCLMKNANTSLPLKIATGMEQTGSGNQKYTGLHLTPDIWTNLRDWTCERMFTSLEVHNLKVRM